jgi:hypothetical protein
MTATSRLAELLAMPDPELDRLAASIVMQWRSIHNAEPYARHFDAGGCISEWGPEIFEPGTLAGGAPVSFVPTRKLDHAFALQTKIERCDRDDAFTAALNAVVSRDRPHVGGTFRLIDATARHRCIAAILAVEGSQ